jgi:hypothetical protein
MGCCVSKPYGFSQIPLDHYSPHGGAWLQIPTAADFGYTPITFGEMAAQHVVMTARFGKTTRGRAAFAVP